MALLRSLLIRLRALFARGRVERELDEELGFHIEQQTEEYLRAGLDPREARRRAFVAFGGVEQAKEGAREARGVRMLEELAKDVRFALRGIRKNPVFAGTLVLVLGLGVGASAAMFSVADALLLRPPPYAAPERIVDIHPVDPESGRARAHIASDAARVWGEAATFMRGVLFHDNRSPLYLGGPEPVTLAVEAVSHTFEETLGVRPVLGRDFVAEDAAPGAAPVAILSHGFWQGAYGGDPAAVGRDIGLDGVPYRIIGVMPEGFKFPTYSSRDAWVPVRTDGIALGEPIRSGYLIGRIATGTIEEAQERADGLAAALADRAPREDGWSVELVPFEHPVNSDVRRAIGFLGGAVALILLIAGVNAVHLLMVRGWARTRELAVRRALGAGRGRLIRQLLTETALLALGATAFAILAAAGALDVLRAIMPESIAFWAPYALGVEGRALAFTGVLAAVTAVLVGAVPALRATRVRDTVGSGTLTPYAAGTPAKSRLRQVLIVSEVALSVVLLIGAGLMIRSFVGLIRVDPGYRVEDMATLRLSLSAGGHPTAEARGEFVRRLEERLEAVPGVEGVVPSAGVPPVGGFMAGGLVLESEDGPAPPAGQPDLLPTGTAGPDFFDVFDIPIVAGRALTAADAGTDAVAVDVDLARFLWGDASPIGRRFRVRPDGDWYTVVGVTGDLALRGPNDREGDFELLYPDDPNRAGRYISLAIATRGDPARHFEAIREAVREVDPRQPIDELATAAEAYAETIELPRFLLVLMSTLSGLALLLTAGGIAGVLAFGVAQRRRELGVRMALGARPGSLARGVLGEGLGLASIGIVLGIAGALALARVIRSLLYEVEPTDPVTLAMVAAVGLGAAAAACYWPARRATRVDPVKVLKAE